MRIRRINGTGDKEMEIIIMEITETKRKGTGMQTLREVYVIWGSGLMERERAKVKAFIRVEYINERIITANLKYEQELL